MMERGALDGGRAWRFRLGGRRGEAADLHRDGWASPSRIASCLLAVQEDPECLSLWSLSSALRFGHHLDHLPLLGFDRAYPCPSRICSLGEGYSLSG